MSLHTNLITPKSDKLYSSEFCNLARNPNIVRFLTACWITLLCNSVFFSKLSDSVFYSASAVLLVLNWLLITLLAVGPLFKPALIAIVLTSVSVEYFSTRFGVMFDYTMLQNILETDTKEAWDLVNLRLVLHFLLYAMPPILYIVSSTKNDISFKHKALQYGCSLATVIGLMVVLALSQYQSLSGYFRMHKEQQYYATPLNAVSAIKSHIKLKLKPKKGEFQYIANAVNFLPFSEKPSIFIVVLGETARADHFGINGYERNTTPNLASLPIVNFTEVSSCGTATAHSVPCMFSWMSKDNYDEDIAKNSENVIDIIKRSGFNVTWQDNNSGCKNMCDRIKTDKLYEIINCEDGCLDDVLLQQLPQLLNQNKNTLIVMHQQGSHGPAYFRRSDAQHKRYLPECKDETFASCSVQEIVNAYDNSLVETDALLGELVTALKAVPNANTGLLYVSDHGESLGENGMYLHGLPYALAPQAQTHVPMFFWLSDSYIADAKLDINCLNNVAANPTSHDALFGSLLGLLSIEIQTDKQVTDLVSPCRG